MFGLVENENEEGDMVIIVQETLVTAKEFRYFETESQYDSTYRVIKCIPNIKCFYSLVIEDNSSKSIFYESHSIKVDDTISTADTVHYFYVEGLPSDMGGTQMYATAIDDCEGWSVSGGAIDGITMALLVVFVAGALMSMCVIRIGKRITYENIHAVQEIEMTDKD